MSQQLLSTAPTDTVDVRGHILDCAEERFRGFGYGKTPMAEIAGDAGMSAMVVLP